jgi:hypothetical protein
MGTSLTATYNITADGAFSFTLNITDQSGVLPAFVIPYLSPGFYFAAYLERYNSSQCGCDPKANFMDDAENAYRAADRFGLAANLIASQKAITDANILINTY